VLSRTCRSRRSVRNGEFSYKALASSQGETEISDTQECGGRHTCAAWYSRQKGPPKRVPAARDAKGSRLNMEQRPRSP